MRIGIVTFHCSYNFGSALQAYALQMAIRSLGHQSCIVDYRSKNFNLYKIIRPTRPWTTLNNLKHYSSLKAREYSFKNFWNQHFILTDKTYTYKDEESLFSLNDSFDCFICGSDQIWNLNCTNGIVEPFFLSFAENARRVAYAPSLAHTSFKSENFDKQRISYLLSRFDYLSIRESETLPLFQPLVNKKIDVTLDPTLLLNADDYQFMVEYAATNEPYFFIYLLRECPELIKSAAAMAEKFKKRIFYISERNLPLPNSVNLFGVGPEEFVSLIAHADAVLTNSFHATVFSILFKKPFRVFATDESASRMRGLLNDLNMPERCVSSFNDNEIMPVEWEAVQLSINTLRRDSWNYLKKALA